MRRTLLACMAAFALPAAAWAQPGPAINGIKSNLRFFNDFTTTVIAPTNTNSVNLGGILSSASIAESGFSDDGIGGSFANRHDFTLSADGGVTNRTFSINDSFTVSTIVNLAVGSNAPRKEAGLRINSSATGDVLFLVNSDQGEIVAFGGGSPFKSFSASPPAPYTPGTSILMGFSMTGGGAPGVPNTIQYFIDRTPLDPAGVEYSPAFAFENVEKGPVAYNVAAYVQATPNLQNSAEFVNTSFTDIRYKPAAVPEPASAAIAAMGLLGLSLLRRQHA